MIQNFRQFSVGPDPFGRTWEVEFRWLQTGISIRHADTVDVKFEVAPRSESGQVEPREERVVALRNPDLLAVSAQINHPITDPWCMKLAAIHLRHMIETGEDIEKTLVTVAKPELERYAVEAQKNVFTAG